MKAISLMDNAKDQVEVLQAREMCIKECFLPTKWKAKVCFTFQMVEYMKAISYKVKNMEKADIFGLMGRSMRESSRMTSVLVLALYFIPMEKDSKEIGKTVKNLVKVLIYSQMDLHIQ